MVGKLARDRVVWGAVGSSAEPCAPRSEPAPTSPRQGVPQVAPLLPLLIGSDIRERSSRSPPCRGILDHQPCCPPDRSCAKTLSPLGRPFSLATSAEDL